jgi:mRNA interferase RelE/StbE
LAWKIEYDPRVLKDLRKLDREVQREILDYLESRIAVASDPRDYGKPLRYSKFGLWRYRVRDFRIVCEIRPTELVILVVAAGHRSIVYDD